jgi:hypothetical protein
MVGIMKQVIAILLAVIAMSAYADNGRHRGHNEYSGHYERNDGVNLLFPLIIGGIIGYEVHKNTEPQVQQPAEPQRGIVIDGVVYVETLQYVPNCNCYRKILVPRQ